MRGLNKAESAALATIALQYGMVVSSGPTAKNGARAGNPIALLLGIISGEVATVFIDDDGGGERAEAIRLLLASEHGVLRDIGLQLRRAAEREGAIENEDIEEWRDGTPES